MSFFSKALILSSQPRWRRLRLRVLLLSVIVLFITVLLLTAHKSGPIRISDEAELRRKFPYTYKYIHTFKKGLGGGKFTQPIAPLAFVCSNSTHRSHANKNFLSAWYIPPNWVDTNQSPPKNIIEAVQLASKVVESRPERHIPYSKIPLLVHQKWDTTKLTGTNEMVLSYIETWLVDAISPPPGCSEMAYFLWDNEGVSTLMQEYEHELMNDFVEVFSPVEKVDIFRIAVCKWFGGIVSLW